MSVIKSIEESTEEILKNISILYLDGGRFDVDPTYSKGRFYKNIPHPIYKFDLNPQDSYTTKADVRSIPLLDKSVNSIVFDPPFMFGIHGKTKDNIMAKRFTMFDKFEDLENMYQAALKEFHRILKKGGIVVFKCQDYTDSKTTMTHCLVYNWAVELGFYAQDIFILLSKGRIYNPKLTQRHARKFHSYYWVFKKR